MDVFEVRTAGNFLRGTEQESDRQLRLTQLGELAGTIMHEVNQPLGAIISSADAALRWLDREIPNVASATRSIQRIRTIAGRSGRTIADLQLLSANILIDPMEQSLNSIVEEALQIFEAATHSRRGSNADMPGFGSAGRQGEHGSAASGDAKHYSERD
ncbi:C4-dicarboxylate-specific signal transduction histidine kinase [Bradyrhizobium sp. LB7.2]|uniref:hypothetical protein n=1 Tax=Bradyrhizobium sp. LB14.3 TaxID=3156328 RepID=UPI0033955C6F